MYSPLFIGSCKTASFESGGGAEVGGGGPPASTKLWLAADVGGGWKV